MIGRQFSIFVLHIVLSFIHGRISPYNIFLGMWLCFMKELNILHKNSLNIFPHSFRCLECILQGSIPSFNLQIAASTYFRSIKKLSSLQILELDSSSISICVTRSTAWNFSLNRFNIVVSAVYCCNSFIFFSFSISLQNSDLLSDKE